MTELVYFHVAVHVRFNYTNNSLFVFSEYRTIGRALQALLPDGATYAIQQWAKPNGN